MAAPKTKIFVGHLPEGCTDNDLRAIFEKYGEVTECDVINKYGFVHMANPDQAATAVKMLNNYNLMGSTISVEPSRSKLHPEPGAPGRLNKQTMMNRARGGGAGGPPGNGYGPPRGGGYGAGPAYGRNGYGRPPYNAPPMGGDSMYDRPYGGGFPARDRMRPYPAPFERRSPGMGMSPMRDEYARRPYPAMPPREEPMYSRPRPPMGMREDLYDRRPEPEPRDDYMYARRSPPPMPAMRSGYGSGYGDSMYDGASRAPPQTATRRPAYY